MLTTTGAPGNTARFQGVIDETRVWTGARNLSQIQSGVHQLPASTTGLVARWSMGEGTGTDVDDGVAPDADGTITGTGTTWPAGAPFDIPTVSAGPNQNVTLPSSALLDGLALDDGLPSALTTTWSQISGPDSAAIANPNSQSTSVSFTGSGPGDYVFRLTAADGTNTIFDEITVTVIDPGPAPNFGLDFDGTNDYVTFGDNATLGLSQFTLETWFRRDGAGVATQTGSGGLAAAIPLITKGRNEVRRLCRRHELLPRHRRHERHARRRLRGRCRGYDAGPEPPGVGRHRDPERGLVPRRRDVQRHAGASTSTACST